LSPVKQAKETLGLAMATEEHGARLFSNGAKPGGVLSTDQVLKDDSFDRIKASWDSAHSGVSNAHKVAILEGGLKWTQVGMSSEDSQFLETRNFQRSEIAGIYRVPPHMIGDLEHATFSNIEHLSLHFVANSLMPLLTRIEQRINFSLLSFKEQSKYYAKFTVNSLLRGDMASRAEFYTRMVQNGAMSPNEIRALEDMNPRTGGDIYLTPLNMAINGKTPKDSK
jgi:HK97 family phage portal protein